MNRYWQRFRHGFPVHMPGLSAPNDRSLWFGIYGVGIGNWFFGAIKGSRNTPANPAWLPPDGVLAAELWWSDENAAFVAVDPARPGCTAHGDSMEEAVRELRDARASWDEARFGSKP